jgi:hypothetical protein
LHTKRPTTLPWRAHPQWIACRARVQKCARGAHRDRAIKCISSLSASGECAKTTLHATAAASPTNGTVFHIAHAHLAFSQRALCLPAAIKAGRLFRQYRSLRALRCCVRAQSTPPYVLLLLEKAVRRAQIFAPYQRTRCERDACHQPRFVVSGCEQREKQSASLSPFLPRRLPCFVQKVDACAPFSGFWDIFYKSEAHSVKLESQFLFTA